MSVLVVIIDVFPVLKMKIPAHEKSPWKVHESSAQVSFRNIFKRFLFTKPRTIISKFYYKMWENVDKSIRLSSSYLVQLFIMSFRIFRNFLSFGAKFWKYILHACKTSVLNGRYKKVNRCITAIATGNKN